MKKNDYRPIPFWSLNDKLEKSEMLRQINSMHSDGIGGFILHARGGLKTEYMGPEWLEIMRAASEEAVRLGMHSFLYDENGWPSGFAGGALLADEQNRDRYFLYGQGKFDDSAQYHYDISGSALKRSEEKNSGSNWLNVYEKLGVATADVCNGEVVDRFIDLTHRKYKEYFGEDFSNLLSGFFTDEPQYYRWHTAFSPALIDYFEREYNEDVFDRLGLLFVEREGFREYRWKYWKGMQQLMLNNFGRKIHEWCMAHDVELTGHYIDEKSLAGQMRACAGIMPFYEHMDIPGIDWLGRFFGNAVAPKQVSSVAAQLGKRYVLTECYAMCGWDVRPRELKHISDFQYLDGVNVMCHHLVPYSETGQRKRDYPIHFSGITPWVEHDFLAFNSYLTEFGRFIGNAKEIVEVAVLQPITSAYLYFKREDSDYCGIRELETSFQAQINLLTSNHVQYHLLDETLLKKYGKAEGASLRMGRCVYKYVVLPTCYNLDSSTDKLLREYCNNGGKVLLLGNPPEYLEGVPYDFDYLTSNTTLIELKRLMPFSVMGGESVRLSLRESRGKKYLVALNTSGTEGVKCEFSSAVYRSFEQIDFMTGKKTNLSFGLDFKPGEFKVLRLMRKNVSAPAKQKTLMLEPPYNVMNVSDNYMTLDRCYYSIDGKKFSKPVSPMGVFQELLGRRYNGKVWLRYSFELSFLPERISLIAEDMNTDMISVNGVQVDKTGVWERERNFPEYNICKFVRIGNNTVELKINFFQEEDVYYALFGDGVTEGLKNCLCYDTTIENLFLKGDFGVFADKWERGKQENVVVTPGGFVIAERKRVLSCPVTEGEPFFAGNITLSKTIELSDTDYKLKIDRRFHSASVSVNGIQAGKLLFDDELDVSRLLKIGNNVIAVTLYTGNRNLLGPLHNGQSEEPFNISPDTFELAGSWSEGVSTRETDNYQFTVFGLTRI